MRNDVSKEASSSRETQKARTTPALRVARVAVFAALAMIFSYVESLLPLHFGVPGIKLGLANLVVVVALAILHPAEAFLISIIRIVLLGLLFGSGASLLYSLAGGLLSFFIMLLLVKIGKFSVYGISVAGAAAHNTGQIAAATVLLGSGRILFYLPILLVAALLTGLLIGVLASRLIRLTLR